MGGELGRGERGGDKRGGEEEESDPFEDYAKELERNYAESFKPNAEYHQGKEQVEPTEGDDEFGAFARELQANHVVPDGAPRLAFDVDEGQNGGYHEAASSSATQSEGSNVDSRLETKNPQDPEAKSDQAPDRRGHQSVPDAKSAGRREEALDSAGKEKEGEVERTEKPNKERVEKAEVAGGLNRSGRISDGLSEPNHQATPDAVAHREVQSVSGISKPSRDSENQVQAAPKLTEEERPRAQSQGDEGFKRVSATFEVSAQRLASPDDRTRFEINVHRFEERTGVKFEHGKVYEISGSTGDICSFDKIYTSGISDRLAFFVPRGRADLTEPKQRYDVYIKSVRRPCA